MLSSSDFLCQWKLWTNFVASYIVINVLPMIFVEIENSGIVGMFVLVRLCLEDSFIFNSFFKTKYILCFSIYFSINILYLIHLFLIYLSKYFLKTHTSIFFYFNFLWIKIEWVTEWVLEAWIKTFKGWNSRDQIREVAIFKGPICNDFIEHEQLHQGLIAFNRGTIFIYQSMLGTK